MGYAQSVGSLQSNFNFPNITLYLDGINAYLHCCLHDKPFAKPPRNDLKYSQYQIELSGESFYFERNKLYETALIINSSDSGIVVETILI